MPHDLQEECSGIETCLNAQHSLNHPVLVEESNLSFLSYIIFYFVYVGWLLISLWSWNWVFFFLWIVWIPVVKCRIFLQIQYWAHSIPVETDYKSNSEIQFKNKQGLNTPFFPCWSARITVNNLYFYFFFFSSRLYYQEDQYRFVY